MQPHMQPHMQLNAIENCKLHCFSGINYKFLFISIRYKNYSSICVKHITPSVPIYLSYLTFYGQIAQTLTAIYIY